MKNKKLRPLIRLTIGVALTVLTGCIHTSVKSVKTDLESWPRDCSLQEVGKRVAENFLPRPNVLMPPMVSFIIRRSARGTAR